MMEPSQRHVAVLAFPFGTHAAPLLALSAGLAAAAPHVAFSFLSTPTSNATLAAFNSTPPNLSFYNVDDGYPVDYVGDPKNLEENLDFFLRVTPGNFRDAMEKAVRSTVGAPVSFILSDCFIWFAGDLAAGIGGGVPWVVFWTGGPRSLSVHLYTDILREAFEDGDRGESMLDKDLAFLPGLEGTRFCDLPNGVVYGDLNSVIARLLHKMGREILRADAVAINTFEGFDSAVLSDFEAKFNKCLPLGPLNLLLPLPTRPDTSGSLKWLDSNLSGQVVYISFGTLVTPSAGEVRDLAEGLEAMGAPFLWSLKRKFWALLPEGFLSRITSQGLVVEWAPQPQVLKHPAVGAFVTHCGWNSVLEGLAGGVPMICRPFLGDQWINERYISHVWKIGVGFAERTMTKGGVVDVLCTVLRTGEGKRMKDRAIEIRTMALRQVQPGGSSSENLLTLAKMVSGG